MCSYCNKELRSCGHEGQEMILNDPRNEEKFYDGTLTSSEKLNSLLSFHKQCIRNLMSYYPEDLTEPKSAVADFAWDNKPNLSNFQRENMGIFRILEHITSLSLAMEDLRNEASVRWFRSAFEGVEFHPYTGSSFDNATNDTLDYILRLRPPRKTDSIAVPNGIWEHYGDNDDANIYESQLKNLDKSISKFMRQQSSEKLKNQFGPLYRHLNIFYDDEFKARVQAQINDVLPINMGWLDQHLL